MIPLLCNVKTEGAFLRQPSLIVSAFVRLHLLIEATSRNMLRADVIHVDDVMELSLALVTFLKNKLNLGKLLSICSLLQKYFFK